MLCIAPFNVKALSESIMIASFKGIVPLYLSLFAPDTWYLPARRQSPEGVGGTPDPPQAEHLKPLLCSPAKSLHQQRAEKVVGCAIQSFPPATCQSLFVP
jgi:hypothetical protein